MSRSLTTIEHFLHEARFDRAPWLVVAFGAGIVAWFLLVNPMEWVAAIILGVALSLCSMALPRRLELTRIAIMGLSLAFSGGLGVVWLKSEIVGASPVARPIVATLSARVLEREDRPAEQRVRLVLATREPHTARAIRVRLNVAAKDDVPGLREGAVIRVRARLVPPSPPLLPGAYDFARAAWFQGYAATGRAIGPIEVRSRAPDREGIDELRARLSAHVRQQVSGTAGTIAAAFASGDRGAISPEDDAAMRDSGLTHLLSISGLHVSAVIAAVYVLALRTMSLWPWLALRVRVPLVASAAGALAGLGYTLLTGAEVPTVRSCLAALLVLGALALGREALSLRMVALAAFAVLLFWPEALVGPSFQMSFAAVLAIVALHGAAPVQRVFGTREEGVLPRALQHVGTLLLTGVVIELALMPIGLFHFHRAGVYGALANVVAIPLTTFVSMPLIAVALALDLFGAGAPFWWLASKSLELLLALAHWTARQPGAVAAFPAMGGWAFGLFAGGGLWLALWRGNVRLWGMVPMTAGAILLAFLRPPDLLVSADGRHVGLTDSEGQLYLLRENGGSYARESVIELSGLQGEIRGLDEWPGARCSKDFCALEVSRGGREWRLLAARSSNKVEAGELAAACAQVDIVIADRRLPDRCRPTFLKADRAMLRHTGGLAIDLTKGRIATVADSRGQHGWQR